MEDHLKFSYFFSKERSNEIRRNFLFHYNFRKIDFAAKAVSVVVRDLLMNSEWSFLRNHYEDEPKHDGLLQLVMLCRYW